MRATFRISVVTYRRPELLRRALRSLIAQSRSDWVAEVYNDDPSDERPAAVIREIADERIKLSLPCVRRGGVANFNQAFRPGPEPFGSLLEDDNWWEPEFLEIMHTHLTRHPEASVACCNERIWTEHADGSWENTGVDIWPASDEVRVHGYSLIRSCLRPLVCNSALLFRAHNSSDWLIPDSTPIDISEHLRERVIPHPFITVDYPLANFADTLTTNRDTEGTSWPVSQMIVIGSVFAVIPDSLKIPLADCLHQAARKIGPWQTSSLVETGCFIPEARALFTQATLAEKARTAVRLVRRPRLARALKTARSSQRELWDFLLNTRFSLFARTATISAL